MAVVACAPPDPLVAGEVVSLVAGAEVVAAAVSCGTDAWRRTFCGRATRKVSPVTFDASKVCSSFNTWPL